MIDVKFHCQQNLLLYSLVLLRKTSPPDPLALQVLSQYSGMGPRRWIKEWWQHSWLSGRPRLFYSNGMSGVQRLHIATTKEGGGAGRPRQGRVAK